MKKKNLKSLSLHKKTVSNLETLRNIQGGEGNPWWLVSFIRACPPDPPAPPPDPTPYSDPAICTGGWGQCPII
jgi:hypothetical protein